MVILQCSRNVKQATGIQKWMLRRMDAWEEDKLNTLVQDTEPSFKSHLTTKQGNITAERRANAHQVSPCHLLSTAHHGTDHEASIQPSLFHFIYSMYWFHPTQWSCFCSWSITWYLLYACPLHVCIMVKFFGPHQTSCAEAPMARAVRTPCYDHLRMDCF